VFVISVYDVKSWLESNEEFSWPCEALLCLPMLSCSATEHADGLTPSAQLRNLPLISYNYFRKAPLSSCKVAPSSIRTARDRSWN